MDGFFDMKINKTKKNNIYGPKFRKIRMNRHISLVSASEGVTSKSTLAEWENGKDNLSWCKVIALLFNIHVQPIEFLESSVDSYLYESIQDIVIAYDANKIDQLGILSQKYLDQYQNNPFDKKLLFKAAMACNFYEDLSGKHIFPVIALEKIIMYFSDVISNDNYWYYEDIFYFNSVTQLMSAAHLYSFALSLLKYVKKEKFNSKIWYELSLNTLLNAVFSLIKKDYKRAEDLLEKLDMLRISDMYTEEIIRKKFMKSLINYVKTKNSTEINSLFKCLDFLSLKKMRLDFQVAFTQIQKIYDID